LEDVFWNLYTNIPEGGHVLAGMIFSEWKITSFCTTQSIRQKW